MPGFYTMLVGQIILDSPGEKEGGKEEEENEKEKKERERRREDN
jgi:hypothetical protein